MDEAVLQCGRVVDIARAAEIDWTTIYGTFRLAGQTLLIRGDYDATLTDTIHGVRQFAMQSGDKRAHVYNMPWWFDPNGGKYPTAFISNLIPPARQLRSPRSWPLPAPPRVRRDHPLRAIRSIVNEAPGPIGRRSILPENLLRAILLQAFYSICRERLLMERREYDLLFRWFSELASTMPSGTIWCSRRSAEGDIAAKFLAAVLAQPKVKKLLSSDHFSVMAR